MFWGILGISPTTDIKEIKKAYSVLAKQNNPEEHPEEFQKIHDAYKKACAYAKIHKMSAMPSIEDSTAEMTAGSVTIYDFSENESDSGEEAKPQETSFDFSHIREEKTLRRSNESATDHSEESEAVGYDFSGLNPDKKRGEKLDFSAAYEDGSDNEDKDTYDFSKVRTLEEKAGRQLTESEVIAFVANRMREMLDDPTVRNSSFMWNMFFNTPVVRSVVPDKKFRKEADKFIGKRAFKKETAEIIAKGFGNGAKIIPDPQKSAAYVDITGKRRKSYYVTNNNNILVWVLLTAACLILYHIFKGSADDSHSHSYESSSVNYSNNHNAGVPVDEAREAIYEAAGKLPLSVTSFTEEQLYALAVGTWEIDSPSYLTLTITENRTFTIEALNDTYNGNIDVFPSDRGAILSLTLNGDDLKLYMIITMEQSGEVNARIFDENDQFKCRELNLN